MKNTAASDNTNVVTFRMLPIFFEKTALRASSPQIPTFFAFTTRAVTFVAPTGLPPPQYCFLQCSESVQELKISLKVTVALLAPL
jgi:hypothetical protein